MAETLPRAAVGWFAGMQTLASSDITHDDRYSIVSPSLPAARTARAARERFLMRLGVDLPVLRAPRQALRVEPMAVGEAGLVAPDHDLDTGVGLEVGVHLGQDLEVLADEEIQSVAEALPEARKVLGWPKRCKSAHAFIPVGIQL